jgi:2'-5' RNA ligase
MKQATDLYFVAIIPEESLKSEILSIKQDFEEQFNSRDALRSPPHITLHMPFRAKPAKLDILIQSLSNLADETLPFEIELDGFGAFPPRIIFILPKQNDDLYELKSKMNRISLQEWKLFDRVDTRPFYPHITVAFRDLRKPAFEAAWEIYEHKVFQRNFDAKSLTLLKHNGKNWDEFQTFPLGESQLEDTL